MSVVQESSDPGPLLHTLGSPRLLAWLFAPTGLLLEEHVPLPKKKVLFLRPQDALNFHQFFPLVAFGISTSNCPVHLRVAVRTFPPPYRHALGNAAHLLTCQPLDVREKVRESRVVGGPGG